MRNLLKKQGFAPRVSASRQHRGQPEPPPTSPNEPITSHVQGSRYDNVPGSFYLGVVWGTFNAMLSISMENGSRPI
jgi:hypothetical protein